MYVLAGSAAAVAKRQASWKLMPEAIASAYSLLTMSVLLTGEVVIVPVVIATLVNVPAAAVPAPMGVLLIVPPVMVAPATVPPVTATLLAFWVDIVPRPVTSVFGMLALAVIAEVPLPLT